MAEEKARKKRPTALKRQMQSVKKYQINKAFKSQVRGEMRKVREAIANQDATLAQNELASLYSLLDKGVKRGIYTRNMASRCKSRFTQKVSSIA